MSTAEGSRKEFWAAFALNFVLPGVGHMYAGATSTGVWLLVGNVLSWALFAAVPIFAVGILGTWIFALVKSAEVVAQHNNTAIANASKVQRLEAERLSPEDLVRQIGKVHQLLTAGMIDESEFDSRKKTILQQVALRTLLGSMDDYLLAAAPLRQAGLLSPEDVSNLKRVLMTGGRE